MRRFSNDNYLRNRNLFIQGVLHLYYMSLRYTS